MKRRFALLLFIAFSLALLGLAFHHHADGASHEDCSVCFQASHYSGTVFQNVPLTPAPLVAMPLVLPEEGSSLSRFCRSPYSNRAPPA
jgi:hypothetical protein